MSYMPMQKILVSACLLGQKVRYDGQDNLINHPIWQTWQEQERLIAVCPEVAGGLATPRPPAEQQVDGRIITIAGKDVTAAFVRGAEEAVALAQQHQIRLAILKAKSPSCGNELIYDGTFQRTLVSGMGLTAKRLTESGVRVFNESQLQQAQEYLSRLEQQGQPD